MTDPTQPALSAPVGPGQPNRPDDLRLVRRYLNAFIARGYFLTPMLTLPDEGGWDDAVARALQAVENTYFFGEADPDNKLETGDTLFQFLVHADLSGNSIASTLSPETYALAAAMVPGGVDRIKRTTVKKQVLVQGKLKTVREVHKELVAGNIRTHLPFVLQALARRQLNDTDMLMMALGTIRAESAAFQPIDEGAPSPYNTSAAGTPGRYTFDLYDKGTTVGGILGNDTEGDGPLFKGRGLVQLTGRYNYTRIGKQIDVDLVGDPDRANEPAVAADVLAQFLKNAEPKIRAALKINDLKHARKLVNGGSHGLEEFKQAFAAGRRVLGIAVAQRAKQALKKYVKTAPPAAKAASAPTARPAGGVQRLP